MASAPLTIAAVMWAGPLVRLLGADGEVASNAEIYLRFSAPGIPALLLSLAGTGYLRGRQDTRTPLIVAVGTNVLNLCLEVWFIYGLDLGIGASAVATAIAPWVGALFYVHAALVAVREHHVRRMPDRRAMCVSGAPAATS